MTLYKGPILYESAINRLFGKCMNLQTGQLWIKIDVFNGSLVKYQYQC